MALALLTGCAVGGDELAGATPEPRAELAEKAEVAAQNTDQATAGSPARGERPAQGERAGSVKSGGPRAGGPADGKYAGTSDAVGGQQNSSSPVSVTRPDDSWAGLVSLDDAAADHGNGPGYADLAAIGFSEHDDRLAVSVTVASVLPAALADREVQGVGIDLFRTSSEESDYQVFLDGGHHGWRAFLQTPDGFVDFPGTFAVEGRTLHVVVPWHAVGGRRQAEVSVFVDWSSGVERLSTDGTTKVALLPDQS